MPKSSQGINLNQSQQTLMNLRQMYLGKLLEMSIPEFEEEIVRAMEENPALTTVETAGESEEAVVVSEFPGQKETEDDERDHDYEGENVAHHRKGLIYDSGDRRGGGAEMLEQQLADLPLSGLEREVAHFVIGNINSSGYLTRTASEIADDMALTDGISVSPAVVDNVIKIVKTLEPDGIGAENLRECLLIQLSRMRQTPAVITAREIIEKQYKAFVNNKTDLILESLGLDKPDFDKAMEVIRTLDPKPGAGLFDEEDERTRHITPDFIVEPDDDGRVRVSQSTSIPELTIEQSYRLDKLPKMDVRAQDFIRTRHEEAKEFINAVRQRSYTLMAIMTAIIKLQPEFFRTFDPMDLKPMVIRDIQEITGFDKSVVSRATMSKYMLTPEGIFSLKSLFGESVSTKGDVSAREIETAIKALVEEEDKAHPLSDDDLTALLNRKGMAVARRTVAKYRERCGIPVARLRRKSV